MNLWQEYIRPTTVAEALQALHRSPDPVRAIAGGTDLMLDLQQGRQVPVHTLVDLNSVQEMMALEVRGDELFIGAAVPVNHIVRNALIRRHALTLIEASDLIGGPQVRNMATLGGNVAHALPAADATIALTALQAQAEVASSSGSRLVPFQQLFLGPGKSALKTGEELVVGFYVPLVKEGQASCFKRVMRPQGVALPILNCAIWLERRGDQIHDIRIAVGPAGPTPFRAARTEASVRGRRYGKEIVDTALDTLLEETSFRTSPQRASAEYRRHLSRGLVKAVLEEAWLRAGKAY